VRFTRRDNAKMKQIGRLQMASMIDVVFLLLIYFMLTTTLEPPESQLTPALATDEPGRPTALQPQTIEHARAETGDGFRVGERVLADQASLTAVLAELPKDAGIVVRSPDGVRVAWAAAAVQAARDAGFEKVTYAPRRE
jgi:biopolymer transport protein ExbD